MFANYRFTVRILRISFLLGATVGISVSQAVFFRSALQKHTDIHDLVTLPAGEVVLKEALHKSFFVSLVAAGAALLCRWTVCHFANADALALLTLHNRQT